jgi:ferrochelatase
MKGVLIVNLGSPNSTEVNDVREYLDQFLMDERVIDFPKLIRKILVKGLILNIRPKKSSNAYKRIWWKEGSPLIVISKKFHKKIQKKSKVPVSLSMRYGNPSIKSGLKDLNDKGVKDVLVIPLYPQFAMSSVETITVETNNVKNKFFPKMKLFHFPSFYNKPDYIKVLSNSIKDFLKDKKIDHLLFSYHGIPNRHILKSDITGSHCKMNGKCCFKKSEAHKYCYRHQCEITTLNVAKKLGLKKGSFSTSYQSRVTIIGSWLKPYTDKTILEFAKKGFKNIAVVTPAFVSDCLETLEEIGMEASEDFKENGGKELYLIPCLNYRDDWVNIASNWINEWALNNN